MYLRRYWRNRLPVLAKLPTGIDEITNRLTKLPTRFLGIQSQQYRLAIWPIPVGDLANTGWRFGQYLLAIWSIPVGDFANTGEDTFSKIWAGSGSKSGILKTWGCLRIMLRYGIKNKKKSILATEVFL